MPVSQLRPVGKLRSRFLAALEPADRARIVDLSGHMSHAVHAWAERYPLIRGVRVAPLSLSVAAGGFPFTTLEALISTARLSLWVFTVDDLFDEGHAAEHELIERAECYRALIHREVACPPNDGLATALCDVRDDLARYPLFDRLGTEWATALCGTVDGMLAEYQWSLPRASLPSYAEYVRNGRYSIGGPPHMWAAVITADDASAPAHVEHLRAMEQLASTSIRLANDLQSFEKEVAEGQINALVILSRALEEQGMSAPAAFRQAAARVQADMLSGLRSLTGLRAGVVTDTGHPEAAMDNIARFVCDFYTHHDYHTFPGV
ncbi:MAG TPA: terpene synthase family protein [Chloroflexota bacterium]|nr:terpene synthase family protein [Chloroflexota bacterium]